MDQEFKKSRTLAQVKLQQNLKNAGETLKRYGLKAHTRDKHALVKHRRAGRPNSEFFAGRQAITARKAKSPTRPARSVKIEKNEFIEMMPETTNQISTRKNTTRRLRQITAMKKQADTYAKQAAKVEEECAKKINTLRQKAKEELQKIRMQETSLKNFLMNKPISRRNLKITKPKPLTTLKSSKNLTIQLTSPKSINNSSSNTSNIFVASGKKGLTSEKGRAWHANIAKARQDIQTFLKSHGIQEKPTGTVAVKYASLLRKDPASASSFRNTVLANIQKKLSASTKLATPIERPNITRRSPRLVNPSVPPSIPAPPQTPSPPTSTSPAPPTPQNPNPNPNPLAFLTA